jgi:hypothetical protein
MHAAVFFDVLEFRGLNQASIFGKCEAFDRADDVDLTGKKTGTNQVGAIDLKSPAGRLGEPLPPLSRYSKSLSPTAANERLRK